MEYLNHLHKQGVKNIEMEATVFAALTHHAGIKGAIVCVTYLDRLKGDQVIVVIYKLLVILANIQTNKSCKLQTSKKRNRFCVLIF